MLGRSFGVPTRSHQAIPGGETTREKTFLLPREKKKNRTRTAAQLEASMRETAANNDTAMQQG